MFSKKTEKLKSCLCFQHKKSLKLFKLKGTLAPIQPSGQDRDMKGLRFLFFVGLLPGLAGCMSAYKKSVGAQIEERHSKIYLTDFNATWQAVLESLKSHPLDISNREAGYIQTKWKDNTAEKNFADSFGGTKAYLKAKFRFKVTVAEGFYNGEPSVKVRVQKEQLVQHDVLEGFRPIKVGSIEEKTLLYRIGRLIYIRMALLRREEAQTESAFVEEVSADEEELDDLEDLEIDEFEEEEFQES